MERPAKKSTGSDGSRYSHSESFWSADESLLFSHIHDQIRVWDVATWSEIRRIELSGSTNSLAADPQGSLIATAYDVREGYTGYGKVDVFRTADGSKVVTIDTKDWVLGVSLSASGHLATWSNGGAVKIWSVAGGSLLQTLRIPKGMPNRAIWSPRESTMVVATTGAEIYVFDARSGEQRFFSNSHVTPGFDAMGLYALSFSSDESWFASKAGDGKVLVWRTTNWQPFAVFEPRAFNFRLKRVPLLAIQPNAPVLLTQNEDCSGLNVWDLGSWASKVSSREHERRSTTSRISSEQPPSDSQVISLGELQRLGEFARWQEVGERLRSAERTHGPLRNYPLFAGWSEPDSDLDIFDGSRWKRVVLKSRNGKQLTYEFNGEVKQLELGATRWRLPVISPNSPRPNSTSDCRDRQWNESRRRRLVRRQLRARPRRVAVSHAARQTVSFERSRRLDPLRGHGHVPCRRPATDRQRRSAPSAALQHSDRHLSPLA